MLRRVLFIFLIVHILAGVNVVAAGKAKKHVNPYLNSPVTFSETGPRTGFDNSVSPQWLLVPLSGISNFLVSVAEGTNFTDVSLQSSNVSIVTLNPTPIIVLDANPDTITTAAGTAKSQQQGIKAIINNKVCNRLNIYTRGELNKTVSVYFVCDNAEHRSNKIIWPTTVEVGRVDVTNNQTTNAFAIGQQVIAALNDYYIKQSNIYWTLNKVYTLKVDENLENEISVNNMINKIATTNNADNSSLQAYFVWKCVNNGGALCTKFGYPGLHAFYMSDYMSDFAWAHDTGHVLNMGDMLEKARWNEYTGDKSTLIDSKDVENLMYWDNGTGYLRKWQVDIINNTP